MDRLAGQFTIFAFLSGLLGAAILVVVLKPGLIRNPDQAEAVRPFGLALGAVLLSGGILAPWLARLRGALWGFATIVVTMVAFYVGLLFAAPALQRPSTRELALVARDRVQPGEPIFHYWAFFHDFVYYSGLPVGLVSHTDELQVQFLAPAERAARFIDEAGLRSRWAGPARVWLVVRKSDLGNPQAVFADPAFRAHVIAETRAILLLSNRP